MSVTLDVVARKWSGFVCPECRLVFRVPRDHSGQGVVCPSCRRLLRLPREGDETEPLTTGMKSHMLVDGVHVKRRHRKARRDSAEEAWERSSSGRSGTGRRRPKWPAAALAGLVATVAFLVWFAGRREAPQEISAGPPVPIVAPVVDEPPVEQKPEKPLAVSESASQRLPDVEPVAKRFLEARSVEELEPLCRKRPGLREKMDLWYADGMDSPGFSSIILANARVEGDFSEFQVTTKGGDMRGMLFEKTTEGEKVDWESWVAWSAMSSEDFQRNKPVVDTEFRVILNPTNYYNYGFSDDRKWVSYRLDLPGDGGWIYGYAPLGSDLAMQLGRMLQSAERAACTLMLRFPPGAGKSNQVIISRLVTEGWVVRESQ